MLLHLSKKSQWDGLKPVAEIGNDNGLGKPRNAFWTSPAILTDRWTSDWVQWCRLNDFYDADREYIGVLLETSTSTNIYEITNQKSYIKASEQFPLADLDELHNFRYAGLNAIDWKAMASCYGGVKVCGTALGLRALSAWDAASVAFFNTDCLTVDKIVDVPLKLNQKAG